MNILVCGHIDHGKTWTIYALMKTLERRFGIKNEYTENAMTEDPDYSINKDPFHYVFHFDGNRYHFFDFFDIDEYEAFLHDENSEVDAALLVCAATDGPLRQTYETVPLLREKGIEKLAVYLNKTDLIDDEDLIDFVKMDIDDLLEENGYSDVPYFYGASKYACYFGGEKYEEVLLEMFRSFAE